MKLKTLAIAVAMAAVPFAVQAEFSVGGDVTVKYYDDGTAGPETFNTDGTEIIFSGSEKLGGLTLGGTATINMNSAGSTLSTDDANVYVKGRFGKVSLGDTDNGCDATDTGWVADDVFIYNAAGGCGGSDQHNITYSRTVGKFAYAASFSPEDSNDNFAVGMKTGIGPVSMSLGYEDGNGIKGGSNVVLGLSGALGPVSVGMRANQFDDGGDADIGFTANYAAGANSFSVGIGEKDNNDTTYFGYNRKFGKKTKGVFEWVSDDSKSHDEIAIGVIHSF